MPWVQWAEISADLSITEWAVWMALRTFADEGGTAWPTRQSIARRCRGSVATVKRALRKLEKCGLILARTRGRHSTTYALATALTVRQKRVRVTRPEGSHGPIKKGHSDPQKRSVKRSVKITSPLSLDRHAYEAGDDSLVQGGIESHQDRDHAHELPDETALMTEGGPSKDTPATVYVPDFRGPEPGTPEAVPPDDDLDEPAPSDVPDFGGRSSPLTRQKNQQAAMMLRERARKRGGA